MLGAANDDAGFMMVLTQFCADALCDVPAVIASMSMARKNTYLVARALAVKFTSESVFWFMVGKMKVEDFLVG